MINDSKKVDPRETASSLRAGLGGLFLVVIVFIATFFRSSFSEIFDFSKKEESIKEIISEEEKDDSLAISPLELFEKNGKKEIVILDIRSRDSFLSEHILDSKNIPAEDLPASLSLIEDSKEYALVDDNGESLVRKFSQEISKNKKSSKISYLSGGFSAWKKDNRPTVSFGDPLSLSDQAKVTYIKTEELKKILDENDAKNFFILDVRKSSDFSDGHIKNAFNIFLEDLEKERKKIPIGKKIIVYDKDGFWAFMGSVRLFDMGIKNTLTLSDGFDRWKEQGFETVK